MVRNSTREFMMISLNKATDLYLSAQLTEGKSPRDVDFLKTRLRYFSNFMKEIQDENFKIQDLEVEDGRDFLSRIDLTMGEMTILGKGNKERKVPFGLQAKKAIMEYLSRERQTPTNQNYEDFVYLNKDAGPMSHTSIEKVFQWVKRLSNVPKLHQHVCRHTFSVRYSMNGRDAFCLQKILGC